MKKVVLPAICILSVTLFSFTENVSTGIITLQPDGNYFVEDQGLMAQEDVNLIMKSTQVYDGAGLFKRLKLFKETIGKDFLKSIFTKDEAPCDCPGTPGQPSPEETLSYILAKYN